MDTFTQKKMETNLKIRVRRWMQLHCNEYESATQLAENCAYYFDPENSYESWLDDETHWIWDIAIDVKPTA